MDPVKKDLYLALLLLAVFFVVWLFAGAASKSPKEEGLFLKSPLEKVSENIMAPINRGSGEAK